jgi:hypothetical protein
MFTEPDVSYPRALPYATQLERDFARARLLAALVTGPCGALLLLASRDRLILGVLGLLCVLASVGWLLAARGGRTRARARADWQLVLERDVLTLSTAEGVVRVLRSDVRSVALDEDTLQVVLQRESALELRVDATWGAMGAVDLNTLLRRWWDPSSATPA